MPGFTDIHVHLLPGLDDGCSDLEQAISLAEGLVELGFSDVHPTPHQKAGAWAPDLAQRSASAAELAAELARREVALTLHEPAGENMWDELFLERQDDGSYPTYEGGRAFLLELNPTHVPPMLEQRLFDIRVKGRLPVLAHIERYADLSRDFKRVEALAERAALLVNLPALGGRGGWRVHRLARKLANAGLVHAVTTDAHGPHDLEHCRAGLRWIERHLGDGWVEQLLVRGPQRIVEGELP